jgi:co-chaperonin GroES (HSP10)
MKPHKITALRAIQDHVLVTEMQFRERQLSSGIILPNDNGKGSGIRARWGQVYAVGPRQKYITAGQWVCVTHGRWTRGIDIEDNHGPKTLRRIDPDDILLVSDEDPGCDDTISDAI